MTGLTSNMDTSAWPFFTVVIPTYNRAQFLVEAVDSILKQTCQDFEVVIVDDGSTDDTHELVRQRFSQCSQVRYVWQENAERGAARNRGFAEARGDYVFFLDSDDLLLTEHLMTLKAAAELRPDTRLLATKFKFIKEGRTFDSPLSPLPEGFYGLDFALRGNPFGCLFCVKRSGLAPRPFQEDRSYIIGEDWIFLVENLEKDQLYLIDRTTVLLREHPGRSMNSDNSFIIARKLRATHWIKENVSLTQDQLRHLEGHSYLFCAVHSYLDSNLRSGLGFWFKALSRLGPRIEVLAMLPKLFLGRRWVRRITSCLALFGNPAPLRS